MVPKKYKFIYIYVNNKRREKNETRENVSIKNNQNIFWGRINMKRKQLNQIKRNQAIDVGEKSVNYWSKVH